MLSRRVPHQPVHQLEPLAAAAGGAPRWRATGDDPQFLLSPERALKAGWYVFATRLQASASPLSKPALYLDVGEGFAEHLRIDLPLSPGERQRILLYLPASTTALRLDPSESPCEFTLDAIRLRRISAAEALLRMAWPLLPRPLASAAACRFVVHALRDSVRRRAFPDTGEPAWRMHQLRFAQAGHRARYHEWCARWEPRLCAPEFSARQLAALRDPPTISIVLPVYDPPEAWLRRCVESILAQTYPHWELCIADDASTLPHVERVLRAYAAREPRIKLHRCAGNGHICAASNAALQLASGRFVALLDHDDELPPYALMVVAAHVERNPGARLLYSDEDKLAADGTRYDPYFKPGFNPELLRGQNFISHLGVFDRRLVIEAGGFRRGFEGSQDYDLALRCLERIDPGQVVHIPVVLYHWRAHANSTASSPSAKNYALEAARKALSEHLRRDREHADVAIDGDYLRVRYRLPAAAPRVSIVVPTRDRLELLKACVDSVLATTDYPDFEVLIVDNGSREPQTLRWFEHVAKADPRVRILPYDHPFNFARLCNHGVAEAAGTMICLLNNDTKVIDRSWLSELVALAVRDGCGAAGAMLLYPDDTIQHAGVILGIGGVAGHAYCGKPRGFLGQMSRLRLRQNLSAVTGACLVVRRDRYLEVGGMDEALAIAFNDVDFCLRLQQRGYRNVWTPYARLYHFESASRGAEDSPQKIERFNGEVAYMRARWGTALEQDPAYNPNLTLTGDPFTLDHVRPAALMALVEAGAGSPSCASSAVSA